MDLLRSTHQILLTLQTFDFTDFRLYGLSTFPLHTLVLFILIWKLGGPHIFNVVLYSTLDLHLKIVIAS